MKNKLITREAIRNIQEKVEKLSNDIRPSSKERHVGIEIEFISRLNAFEIGQLILNANLEKVCQLKEDGSVESDYSTGNDYYDIYGDLDNDYEEFGHELAVLCKESDYKDTLKKVAKVLKQADAFTNETCGLHVHVDSRDRDVETVFKNLSNSQNVLYSMNPARRLESEYCSPTRYNDLDSALEYSSRHSGINAKAWKEHKTIEVRIHTGTVDCKQIANWIKLLISVANAGAFHTECKNVRQFARVCRLDNGLKKYVAKQLKKYNNGSLVNIDEDDIEYREEY